MSDTSKGIFTQAFVVVGAIIERGGKFLLVKENKPADPDHGKWNQPAGWIDVGEHPIIAVVREVKEETGLTFTPTHILGLYSLVRKDNEGKLGKGSLPHALKIIFTGTAEECPGGRFDQNEILEIRWFSPEEIYVMDGKILRNMDIKDLVRNYIAGKRYPLELLTHTIQE